MLAVDDPTWLSAAPFLAGWVLGWLLLWRLRPLPPVTPARSGGPRPARPPISFVVPARDEAESLPELLGPLLSQTGPDDEVIVVDDHSSDATADIARRHGARVVVPDEPPPGWLGKPNACHHGARAARTDVLAFLDADVRPGDGFVERLADTIAGAPDALVSVQPWHVPGRPDEHLSLFCNVAALMGAGRFSLLGDRVSPAVAFGPVLAMRREVYESIGGHAAPSVRGAHTEDIALARLAPAVELFTGRGRDGPVVSFRMYPGGLGDLVRGWTRSIATGAGAAARWTALATAAWVWAIAAAPFVAWWAYALAAVQVAVLARRAGRFSPLLAAVYPLSLVVFVAVLVRSAWRTIRRRDVTWKGRDVPSR